MEEDVIAKQYYRYAEQAGAVLRQLSFAGLGAIWIFRVETSGKTLLPTSAGVAGFLLVTALALEVLHFLCGAMVWARRAHLARAAENEPSPVQAISKFTIYFLLIRAVIVTLAYCVLLKYLGTHLYALPNL